MTESKRTAEQAELTTDVAEVKRVGELTPIMYKPPAVVDMPLREFQFGHCAVRIRIVPPDQTYLVHSLAVSMDYSVHWGTFQTAAGSFVNGRRLCEYLKNGKEGEHVGWITATRHGDWRVVPTILENTSFRALCDHAAVLQSMVTFVNVVPSLQALAAAAAIPCMGVLGISALQRLCAPEHLAEAVMRVGGARCSRDEIDDVDKAINVRVERIAELTGVPHWQREKLAKRLRRRMPVEHFPPLVAALKEARQQCDTAAEEQVN